MPLGPHYFIGTALSAGELSRVISRLPGVGPAVVTRARRAHLDTFDRRLRAAGQVLEADILADRCVLRFRPLGSEDLAWTLEAERPPRFARDFDNPDIRTQLAPLLATRALLHQVSCAVRSTVFPLADDHGRITVRLIVEDYLGACRDPGRRLALRVRTLRGGEEQAGAALAALGARLSLEACASDISTAIEERAGAPRAVYTAKPVARILPETPADKGVAMVLGGYRAVMLANEDGMRSDIDIEFLHDFRVAMRRLRSVLNQMDFLLPAPLQRRFRKALSWLNRATGRHRDLDVFLLKLEDYARILTSAPTNVLEPLRELLQKERRREHAKLVRTLNTQRYRQWQLECGTVLAEILARESGQAPPTIEVANAAIWRMYTHVRTQSPAIVDAEQIEPIHELRKDCKKLRYLIEAFQTVYPADAAKRAVHELKALQDVLGERCDISVQCALLAAWGERLAGDERVGAATNQAIATLRAAIAHRGELGFAELGRQIGRFNRSSNHAFYRRTFRPTDA